MMLPIEHIHPILVHFPIVLLPIAVGLDFIAATRHGNLAAARGIPVVSLGAITLGTLAAVAAAVFGGIAMDVAVQKGYSEALFEDHEGLAWTTVWFFGALTVVRLYAWRRAVNLSGVRGWGVVAAGLIGVGILVATAFHGGELVYGHGVNVAAVQPGNFYSDSERGGRSGPVFPLRYDTLPDSGSSAYRLGATAQPTCCRPAS